MSERIRGKAIHCLILTIFWAGLILLRSPFEVQPSAARLYFNEWVIMIVLSYLVVLLLSSSPSRNFLVISIVIGTLFALYGPLWSSLDENTQYFRSFAISEGYWHDAIDDKGNYGANLPANFDDSLSVNRSPIELLSDADALDVPYSPEKEWYTTPYMSSALPFDHMIAAIGIRIGTLMRLPIVGVILLARFTDLIFYIVLTYLAIRRMKYYKIVFFTMAAIPFTLYLAGCCSQDAVHIAATFLFLAMMLSYVFEDPAAQVNAVRMETGYIDPAALGESEDSDANAGTNISSAGKQLSAAQLGGFAEVRQPKKIDAAQITGILVLFLFVASAKYLIYSLLFVLVFFIPKERFEKPALKKWLILSGFSIIVLLAGYQVYMLRTFPFVANGDVDAGRQLAYVSGDIAGALRIFGRYFTGPFLLLLSGAHMFEEFSGGAYVLSLVIVLVGVLAADKYRWESSRRRAAFRWVSGLTIFVMSMLIIAAFYIGCTPVGSANVEGVQMSWLIPFMPLLGTVIADMQVESKVRNMEEKTAFVMVLGNMLLLGIRM